MSRFFRRFGMLLALAASLLAAPALARNVTADLNDIAGLLRDKGHKVSVKAADGESYLRVEDEGAYSYSIFFYGCDDKGTHCKSLQFYASFTTRTKPSLEELNTYNSKHRFGRAYLDKEGFPNMEFDLNLNEGGMNEPLFIDTVGLWDAMIEVYAEFLFGRDGEKEK